MKKGKKGMKKMKKQKVNEKKKKWAQTLNIHGNSPFLGQMIDTELDMPYNRPSCR